MNYPEPPLEYLHYSSSKIEPETANIMTETPVTLMVNGNYWLTFMCTPKDQEDLAVGFLYNEEIIHSLTEIENLHLCDKGDMVDIWLNHPVTPPSRWQRTSGCTGGFTSTSIENEIEGEISLPAPILNHSQFDPEKILSLLKDMYQLQELYSQMRGVHCSALSDGKKLLVVSEDIGRHNTLDKISGNLLRTGLSVSNPILLTTGRISSEMAMKAGHIKAEVVVSRTSPSSRAVRYADQMQITIIGYAGYGKFNLYTHPGRLGFKQIQKIGQMV
jgi:FdhD protein